MFQRNIVFDDTSFCYRRMFKTQWLSELRALVLCFHCKFVSRFWKILVMLTTLQYVEDMAEKDLTIEKLLKKNREICLSEKFFEYKYEEALNGKNFLEKEVEMLEKLLQQKNEKERKNMDV